jgi:nucleotide-binding universal stress UspA family protein
MQNSHNILFVSRGIVDETEALKQALSLASNNKATLKALIVCPEFPSTMADYKEKYQASLEYQLQQSIDAARKQVKLNDAEVSIQIDVESGDTPAIGIIQHVLRYAHDLVIKAAEPKDDGKGFKVLDMDFLRQCPCPVWLCRPIVSHRGDIRVAVAIDPESKEKAGHDLSLRLLEISRSLADTCNGELNIISCWDFKHEKVLRDNIFIRTPEKEIKDIVVNTKTAHKAALENLISESNIAGKIQVDHVRGSPDTMIPKTIEAKKIDILVMGTVARTGVAGFFIGNTAENVLQKIECTLLALKPNGFASPVKAY